MSASPSIATIETWLDAVVHDLGQEGGHAQLPYPDTSSLGAPEPQVHRVPGRYQLSNHDKLNNQARPSCKRSFMPTPTGSDHQSRRVSPAKRLRLESSVNEDSPVVDTLETSSLLSLPTTESRRLSTFPSLPASSATRRSASPTKTVRDLLYFKKPVSYIDFSDNPEQQLPEDVRDLYRSIYNIGQLENFIPAEVKDDILAIVGKLLFRDRWFHLKTADLTREQQVQVAAALELRHHGQRTLKPTTAQEFAVSELDVLRDIEKAAKDCLGSSEAAWNARVHVPLLDHALAGFTRVRAEPATTAQIAKGAIPSTSRGGGEVSQGKMIDIAIVLRLDMHPAKPPSGREREDQRLADAVRSKLGELNAKDSDGFESVNQTSYGPLRFSPIAVSIETKVSGDQEAGRVQLGVWTASWHQRMETFRRGQWGPDDARHSIVTLPLLLVVAHDWRLFFACDRGDRIEIVGGVPIGHTTSLVDTYRIVAVLRELARWVEGPYRKWVESWFLVD